MLFDTSVLGNLKKRILALGLRDNSNVRNSLGKQIFKEYLWVWALLLGATMLQGLIGTMDFVRKYAFLENTDNSNIPRLTVSSEAKSGTNNEDCRLIISLPEPWRFWEMNREKFLDIDLKLK